MEIQVGEYVKSTDGFIAKVEEIDEDFIDFDSPIIIGYDGLCSYFGRDQLHFISKHSFNIIDLIEEGDYINGYKVLDIDFKNEMICLLMPFDEENKSKYNIVWNTKYFIKSIVTKEMFQNIEYRVESN